MKRTLVISDIHGELELFKSLLTKINYLPEEDQLILLGDYVDRGTNSAGVMDYVISLHNKGAIVLKGNHEDMMHKSLTTNNEADWNLWTRLGGFETLQSYGFKENEYKTSENEGIFQKPTLTSPRLEAHLAFIQTLPLFFEDSEIIFVHAGVKQDVPLAETKESDLLWIRDEFHHGYNGDKKVIFGHTPTARLRENKNNHSVFFGENKIIGIDGGAVFGGQLNCLELPSLKITSITKLDIIEPS